MIHFLSISSLTAILLAGLLLGSATFSSAAALAPLLPYTIVDTGQDLDFDDSQAIVSPPKGAPYYGQDANYLGNQPHYRDNGDGTISDLNTGLMWVKARGEEVSWEQAMSGARSCRTGGYADWRAPTIKELYSLIDFRGQESRNSAQARPFLDTRFFAFTFGNTAVGKRLIDCQDWSATRYVSSTMRGTPTAFGVNFADGRIKGYGLVRPINNQAVQHYVRYVRGNPHYGLNKFTDNGDGTVTDQSTGLIWQQRDSGKTFEWKDALSYAQNLILGGHNDWRLPNAKELQSIVDYGRSPVTSHSAAIDPLFKVSDIESYYWSSTTHLHDGRADSAVYVAFGRALGYMRFHGPTRPELMDVHGAGAQRSDPKSGDPAGFPYGRGPQGDDIRIFNYVRCVRGGTAREVASKTPTAEQMATGQTERRPPRQQQFSQQQFGQPPVQGRGPQHMGPSAGNPLPRNPGNMRSPQGQGPRQPPQEAFAACQNHNQGTPCSFNAPRGPVNGMCRPMRNRLACVPDHGPDQGPHPPQGAGPGPRGPGGTAPQ